MEHIIGICHYTKPIVSQAEYSAPPLQTISPGAIVPCRLEIWHPGEAMQIPLAQG